MNWTWYLTHNKKDTNGARFRLTCHLPDFTHKVFDAEVTCTAHDGNVAFGEVRKNNYEEFHMGEDAVMATLLMWWGNEQYAGLKANEFFNKLGVVPIALGGPSDSAQQEQ